MNYPHSLNLTCPLCNDKTTYIINTNNQIFSSFDWHESLGDSYDYTKQCYYYSNGSSPIPPHKIDFLYSDSLSYIIIYLDDVFFNIKYTINTVKFGSLKKDSNITLPLNDVSVDLDYFSIHNFIQTQLTFL